MPSKGLRYAEIIELPVVSCKTHPEEMCKTASWGKQLED